MSLGDTFIRDPAGGENQSGLRDRNARLVLSYIRRHGALASAEIARRSGLSAQTVSNIIRALEGEGLLVRGEAVKGRVGKPSVPVALNPGGVLSLGLNIGRRSAELVLVDFRGTVVDSRATTYDFPSIDGVFSFLKEGIEAVLSARPSARSSIVGLGVSRPNRIWDWLEVVRAPRNALRQWRDLDLGAAMAEAAGVTVYEENDATSACVAEQLLGRGSEFHDFAYIFVGAFVGGGLVLDGKVLSGANRNAAQIGPLPVPDGRGGTVQLLNVASLHRLERAVEAAGGSPEALRRSPDDWSAFGEIVSDWVGETSRNLAIAAAAIVSVVEVEAVLIDGAMPVAVRGQLQRETAAAFNRLDLTGMVTPRIEEASVGRGARSLGAAMLPIHARYFLA